MRDLIFIFGAFVAYIGFGLSIFLVDSYSSIEKLQEISNKLIINGNATKKTIGLIIRGIIDCRILIGSFGIAIMMMSIIF